MCILGAVAFTGLSGAQQFLCNCKLYIHFVFKEQSLFLKLGFKMEISAPNSVFRRTKITVYLKAASKEDRWRSSCDQLYEALSLSRVGENPENHITL